MKRTRLLLGITFAAIAALPAQASAQLLFQDQGPDTLGTQFCNGGCWTNYARMADLDGDGHLDLLGVNCGGFFSNPTPQPLTLWTNDGAGDFAGGAGVLGGFTGAVRQVALGDVDGDGDIDVVVPAAGGEQLDALFIRQPDGTLANEAAARLPAGLSSDAGAARLGDIDNDGDLDLFLATGYINDNAAPARLYRNDGNGVFAEAAGALPTTKNGINPDDIDLADVDGDFDLDVYINMHEGQSSLWINDGAGAFSDASGALPPLSPDAQFHYGPVFCDVDGDRDRDLFIDNTADGYDEQLLINDGGSFTDETAARITGNIGADDNLVACLDYDGDGDFDFAVGALSPGRERVFENDGAGSFALVQGAFDGPTDPTLWMEFGDLNGDGRLDAFTAQGEGNLQLERVYLGTASVAADTRPPAIFAIEPVAPSPSAETVVRFAVADNAVTDEGPRLRRAWIQVGDQQVDARFMGGDLYRAVIPATSATLFTACATDWAGNTTPGCSGGSGTGGGGGAGGSGPTGSGGGTGAAGGSENPAGPQVDDSGGCGCGVPGDAPTAAGALAVALGLLAAASRRRRSP
jgi:MYXO-CTERM domain-containing protein